MSYAADNLVPWPVPPDWTDGVRERLEWLTDVIRARNGRAQRRKLRRAPRRYFEFSVIADEQARRVTDALLMDHGAKPWMLPIWPDVQLLEQTVPAGAMNIPCRTGGFDFVAGGRAMLWRAINDWVLVDIAGVQPNALTITSACAVAWPAGTRLYPVRRARLDEQPAERGWTDAAGERRVTMIIDEPCDWPAVLPATLYRGYPVLEWRPDAGEDHVSSFGREVELVDVATGPVAVYDHPDRPFRRAVPRWLVHGRTQHAALRSLLYGLAGRWRSVWVPTWHSDLVLIGHVAAGAGSITVEWAGYTVFGRMQPGWRDLRIELGDGTVLYRRITSAAEAGGVEELGLDAPLGIYVAPADVRAISFMVLSVQESDVVELEHVTDADGLTICSTRFVGDRNDV